MGWCRRESLFLGLRNFTYFADCCISCGLGCFVVVCVLWRVLCVCLDFWFSVLCCGFVGLGCGLRFELCLTVGVGYLVWGLWLIVFLICVMRVF